MYYIMLLPNYITITNFYSLFIHIFFLRLSSRFPAGLKFNRQRNPYKKRFYFCRLFLCTLADQGVHPFFLFPTNILSNKVKQVCFKIIFINSLIIIIYDFLKIFNIVGNLKCGHHEKSWRKVGVKAATFLTGLPPVVRA